MLLHVFLRPVSRRFTECLFQLTMTRQMVYIVFDSQCSPVPMNREIFKGPQLLGTEQTQSKKSTGFSSLVVQVGAGMNISDVFSPPAR